MAVSVAVSVGSLGLVGARDPGATNVVYGVVVGLAVLGVALAAFAWWLVRTTRPDPEVLAPLETMQTRRWKRLDPAGQRRLLDSVRPAGAEPVAPEPAEPAPDAEFGDEPQQRDVNELSGANEPQQRDVSELSGVVGEPSLGAAAPVSGDDWERWDARLGLEPEAGELAVEGSDDARPDRHAD